jgi:hypothetical protein
MLSYESMKPASAGIKLLHLCRRIIILDRMVNILGLFLNGFEIYTYFPFVQFWVHDESSFSILSLSLALFLTFG